jgi:hypothetical protein
MTSQVVLGATATFSAAAWGAPAPTVTWQQQILGATTWTTVTAGATTTSSDNLTSSSVFVPVTIASSEAHYRVTFTNASGEMISAPVVIASGVSENSNWSGYAATGTDFSAISASWVVPTALCDPTAAGTAEQFQWVGIDGFSSQTVEQAGTAVSCYQGVADYGVWYEMYGYPSPVNTGGWSPSLYPVAPGDAINSSVSVTNGVWTLAVHDVTAGWTATEVTSEPDPQPQQVNAEVIVETPSWCPNNVCQTLPMPDTTPITFSDVSITSGSTIGTLATFNPQVLDTSSNNVLTDTPGPVSSNGTSFTVTYVGPPA